VSVRHAGTRVRFPAWVAYPKEEVFAICTATARAEALLATLGLAAEAAQLAAVLELLELGLGRRLVPGAQSSEVPAATAGSSDSVVSGSNSRARELTQ